MNGPHDLGGLHGFGAIATEPADGSGPKFHAPWERRALGLTLAMGAAGRWTLDRSRATREGLPPAVYLSSPCYGIWILALQRLLLEERLLTADELATGQPTSPAVAGLRVLPADAVDAVLARGSPTERPARTAARFAAGDRVRAANRHPAGHVRLPRYVRGHVGTVTRVHGAHLWPEVHALPPRDPDHRDGWVADDTAVWLYTVTFDGETLWGPDAEPGTTVSADLFEPDLQAVDRVEND
jgi:nitrile hydratase